MEYIRNQVKVPMLSDEELMELVSLSMTSVIESFKFTVILHVMNMNKNERGKLQWRLLSPYFWPLKDVFSPTTKGCCMLKYFNDNLSKSCTRKWLSN